MESGLDLAQFRTFVVRPVLQYLGLHSQAAENLVVGTALVESRLKYIKQIGGGPALGVFQMEPNTYNDIYHNYLSYRPDLKVLVDATRDGRLTTLEEELVYNLAFAAAMCRVHYVRVKHPLPAYTDAVGMAEYWKAHYNTPLGAGTVEKALPYFQKACV